MPEHRRAYSEGLSRTGDDSGVDGRGEEQDKGKMVTQQDVAERANVSTTTVSHVINETRFVSKELRERVYTAMEELDYQPNAIARSLRRKRTEQIGVILPDIAYPFLAEVAGGVEEAGHRMGYKIIFCASHQDAEKELACLNLARSKQVDGIMFLGAGPGSRHLKALVERGTPAVSCNRRFEDVQIDSVTADNVQAGLEATSHLIGLGHHRVGCIAGRDDIPISRQRLDGYRSALKELGIPVRDTLIVQDDFGNRGGYDAMNRLLGLPEPPTAVFACNDLMAMGAICAASKRRLRVPEDVAVIGCDDIALAAFTNPSLSTMALPKRELGTRALELLVRRIEDGDQPVERQVLPVRLVVRDSC